MAARPRCGTASATDGEGSRSVWGTRARAARGCGEAHHNSEGAPCDGSGEWAKLWRGSYRRKGKEGVRTGMRRREGEDALDARNCNWRRRSWRRRWGWGSNGVERCLGFGGGRPGAFKGVAERGHGWHFMGFGPRRVVSHGDMASRSCSPNGHGREKWEEGKGLTGGSGREGEKEKGWLKFNFEQQWLLIIEKSPKIYRTKIKSSKSFCNNKHPKNSLEIDHSKNNKTTVITTSKNFMLWFDGHKIKKKYCKFIILCLLFR